MRRTVPILVLAMMFTAAPAFAQYCLLGDCDETSEVMSWQGQSWILNAVPTPGQCPTTLGHHHFVISEICVGEPEEGEFIELCNTTGVDLYLGNFWITDDCNNNDNDYVNIVNNGPWAFPPDDFIARFPRGYWFPDNSCITIAPDGNNFFNTYGFYPDYELKSVSPAVDMITIGGTASIDFFANDDEMILLFCWRGEPGVWGPDWACDVDYVNWGTSLTAVDKTGICIDGPDADAITTCYLNDTNPMFQFIMNADNDGDPMPHDPGFSAGRQYCKDAQEICSGGNACLNGSVPIQSSSWGFIKSMYR